VQTAGQVTQLSQCHIHWRPFEWIRKVRDIFARERHFRTLQVTYRCTILGAHVPVSISLRVSLRTSRALVEFVLLWTTPTTSTGLYFKEDKTQIESIESMTNVPRCRQREVSNISFTAPCIFKILQLRRSLVRKLIDSDAVLALRTTNDQARKGLVITDSPGQVLYSIHTVIKIVAFTLHSLTVVIFSEKLGVRW
jgi:hypothetical protein